MITLLLVLLVLLIFTIILVAVLGVGGWIIWVLVGDLAVFIWLIVMLIIKICKKKKGWIWKKIN